jgi:hypothetical protein
LSASACRLRPRGTFSTPGASSGTPRGRSTCRPAAAVAAAADRPVIFLPHTAL